MEVTKNIHEDGSISTEVTDGSSKVSFKPSIPIVETETILVNNAQELYTLNKHLAVESTERRQKIEKEIENAEKKKTK